MTRILSLLDTLRTSRWSPLLALLAGALCVLAFAPWNIWPLPLISLTLLLWLLDSSGIALERAGTFHTLCLGSHAALLGRRRVRQGARAL